MSRAKEIAERFASAMCQAQLREVEQAIQQFAREAAEKILAKAEMYTHAEDSKDRREGAGLRDAANSQSLGRSSPQKSTG